MTNVGVPNRIYTWGQSLGGLAALRSGQDNDWVSGSASMCGLLGGLNPNMDLALDAAVGVKALLAPKLTLTGFTSAEDARAEYDRADERGARGLLRTPQGAGLADLQVIAAVAEIPTQTRTSAGDHPGSTPGGARREPRPGPGSEYAGPALPHRAAVRRQPQHQRRRQLRCPRHGGRGG